LQRHDQLTCEESPSLTLLAIICPLMLPKDLPIAEDEIELPVAERTIETEIENVRVV
jgi:hypothetical protein